MTGIPLYDLANSYRTKLTYATPQLSLPFLRYLRNITPNDILLAMGNENISLALQINIVETSKHIQKEKEEKKILHTNTRISAVSNIPVFLRHGGFRCGFQGFIFTGGWLSLTAVCFLGYANPTVSKR